MAAGLHEQVMSGSEGDLRGIMEGHLTLEDVGGLWFDLFGEDYLHDLGPRTRSELAKELISRSKDRNRLGELRERLDEAVCSFEHTPETASDANRLTFLCNRDEQDAEFSSLFTAANRNVRRPALVLLVGLENEAHYLYRERFEKWTAEQLHESLGIPASKPTLRRINHTASMDFPYLEGLINRALPQPGRSTTLGEFVQTEMETTTATSLWFSLELHARQFEKGGCLLTQLGDYLAEIPDLPPRCCLGFIVSIRLCATGSFRDTLMFWNNSNRLAEQQVRTCLDSHGTNPKLNSLGLPQLISPEQRHLRSWADREEVHPHLPGRLKAARLVDQVFGKAAALPMEQIDIRLQDIFFQYTES